MGQAAYIKKGRVSSDDGATWHELPGSSVSLDFSATVLDDTELSNNEGYRRRLLGLLDWSISAECMWNAGNQALEICRNALMNRTELSIQYLPQGVSNLGTGFQGKVVVENFNTSGDVDALESVSISFQATNGLVAAS